MCHARCEIVKCSEEGVVVMDAARLRLDDCIVRGNMGPGEQPFAPLRMLDGCICPLRCLLIRIWKIILALHDMHVHRPSKCAAGVDVSDSAAVECSGGAVRGNVGGVWVWQSGYAKLDKVNLEGGSSYVILADHSGMPTLTVRNSNMIADCVQCATEPHRLLC